MNEDAGLMKVDEEIIASLPPGEIKRVNRRLGISLRQFLRGELATARENVGTNVVETFYRCISCRARNICYFLNTLYFSNACFSNKSVSE